jgi:hypothetical protein
VTPADHERFSRCRHTVSCDLGCEGFGEPPGYEETCWNGQKYPGPSRVPEFELPGGDDARNQIAQPFESKDQAGRADTDTGPNEGGKTQEPTHLTFGQGSHSRQAS